MAIKCLYVENCTEVEASALTPGTEYKLIKSNLSWNWPEARLLPELVSPYSFVATLPGFRGDAFLSNSHRKVLDFNEHLSRQALEIISRNNVIIEDICTQFFAQSIKWFPIIDREEIFDRLLGIETAPDAHFSVLLLCIFLFTKFWAATSDEESTIAIFDELGSLYFTVKGFYSLLLSTGRVSTDGVQAGILLAMYEQCQCFRDASALSIASAARMGHLLGFENAVTADSHRGSMTDMELTKLETLRRLWWAVLIVER